MPTTDGAGVKLTRMVGTPELDMVDPFLMLDRMDTDDPDCYIAGFPDHPHRGFETVTIMLEGRMRHRDSVGNDGLLGPGQLLNGIATANQTIGSKARIGNRAASAAHATAARRNQCLRLSPAQIANSSNNAVARPMKA